MMRKEVFVVGGGPSLKGFDFSQLAPFDTIAVNMSALDVPNPTFCITADSGIFMRLQKGEFSKVETTWVVVSNPEHATMKFRDGRFTNQKNGFVYNPFTPNMLIRNAGTDGLGLTWSDFRTGYNSGFCAFQFAFLMGYEKIYLLGIDLASEGVRGHYHDYYSGRTIQVDDLNRYADCFREGIMIAKQFGVETVSCSPTSVLNNVIPYKPFDSIEFTPVFSPQQQKEASTNIKWSVSRIRTNNIRFSILICSLKRRHDLLQRLLDCLHKQRTPEVEIIAAVDNGEIPTGTKRNLLLSRALGDYVAFIDDDDMVPHLYISQVLKAVSGNPDCADLWGEIIRQGVKRKFVHSIKYDGWFERGGTYYRCPNHLNAIKRELALKVRFADITRGEDRDFSLRLRPLLKTEGKTETVIYYYMAG